MANLTADLEAGFRVRLTAGIHQWYSDETAADGGADSGPSPYELLLGSLAACTAITLRLYAQHKGIELPWVRLEYTHSDEDVADADAAVADAAVADVADADASVADAAVANAAVADAADAHVAVADAADADAADADTVSDEPLPERITANVTFGGQFTDAQRVRLTQIVGRCPVHRTLERGVTITESVVFAEDSVKPLTPPPAITDADGEG